MQNNTHPPDERLNEYLDGELSPQAHSALQAHLAACAPCASRLEALQALFSAIESLPDLALERDLSPAILESITRRQPAPVLEPQPYALRLVFIIQAVLALLLLGFAYQVSAQAFTQSRLVQNAIELWNNQSAQVFLRLSDSWSKSSNALTRTGQMLLTQGQTAWESLADQPNLFQMPAAELATLMLLASLLWLAANGLLLTSRQSRRYTGLHRAPSSSKRRE